MILQHKKGKNDTNLKLQLLLLSFKYADTQRALLNRSCQKGALLLICVHGERERHLEAWLSTTAAPRKPPLQ